MECINAVRGRLPKVIVIACVVTIVALNIEGGIVESLSANNLNSRNILKNSNYKGAIDTLISQPNISESKVITDNTFSMSYFLSSGKTPDYVAINTDYTNFSDKKLDPYTNAPEIDFRQIPDITGPKYFILNYQPDRMGSLLLNYLNTIGTKIYEYRSRKIYFIAD
jgi:hypothetical protein